MKSIARKCHAGLMFLVALRRCFEIEVPHAGAIGVDVHILAQICRKPL